LDLAPVQGYLCDIHPDGTVTRGGGVDRNAKTVCGRQNPAVFDPRNPLSFRNVFPEPVMELRGPHFLLKFAQPEELSKKRVRGEKDLVVENDVINANDPKLFQETVVG